MRKIIKGIIGIVILLGVLILCTIPLAAEMGIRLAIISLLLIIIISILIMFAIHWVIDFFGGD